MFLRRRGEELGRTNSVRLRTETAHRWALGFSGRVRRRYASAAAIVGAFFALGVYTAGADGNDPAAKFTESFNDVLFVGVAGVLINNAPLQSALVDGVSIENTFVNTGATSEPTDRLVNSGDQAAE